MAARPSAFNSDLPILYAAVAGLLFLIVEFRKLVNMLKNVTNKIINSAKSSKKSFIKRPRFSQLQNGV